MADDVYPYDAELLDRSFLNCYQRQAMVMLAEQVPDLPELFYNTLVSTDTVLEQVIRQGVPKYDLQTDLLAPDALARLGIAREYRPFDRYEAARPTLLEAVHEVGHVIPFIDVFYLPHCPEYLVEHVVHTITLVDHDPATGTWGVLDDNRASVLCRYRYPEDVVAAAYDNGKMRHVSWFPSGAYDAEDASRDAGRAFVEVVARFEDSRRLLSHVDEILTDPWMSTSRSIALLYDVFAALGGSRACLGAFTARHPAFHSADPQLAGLVAGYRDVRNHLMIGRATGRVDVPRVRETCAAIRTREEGLLGALEDAIAVEPAS